MLQALEEWFKRTIDKVQKQHAHTPETKGAKRVCDGIQNEQEKANSSTLGGGKLVVILEDTEVALTFLCFSTVF